MLRRKICIIALECDSAFGAPNAFQFLIVHHTEKSFQNHHGIVSVIWRNIATKVTKSLDVKKSSRLFMFKHCFWVVQDLKVNTMCL